MREIRAAICTSFDAPLVIEKIQLAEPGRGQLCVDLEAVAICHSDITFAKGGWGGALPAIFGHEAVGRVSSLGPDVQRFRVGQRVLVTLLHACKACSSCDRGRPAYCNTSPDRSAILTRSSGEVIFQGMACGAFAEAVVVDQTQLAALPENIPSESAALLACGVLTGMGAVVHAAKLRAGEDVVVLGAGGVGLNAIQGARLGGGRRIVAVDISAEKLQNAKDFGATDVLLAGGENPGLALEELIGRRADIAVSCTGAVQALAESLEYLAPQGRVVWAGMPHNDASFEFFPVGLVSSGQKIIGTKMGEAVLSRDIPWLVDLYQQDRLALDKLVGKTWQFEEINEAIAHCLAGGAGRNVLRMPFSDKGRA